MAAVMHAEVSPGVMATRRYAAFPHSGSTSSTGAPGRADKGERGELREEKASSGRSKSPFSRSSRGQGKKGGVLEEENGSRGPGVAARLFGQGGGGSKGAGYGRAAAGPAPGPGHSIQRSSSFTGSLAGSFSISSPVLVASTVNLQGHGTGDATRAASTFDGSAFESEQALRATLSEAHPTQEGQGQGQVQGQGQGGGVEPQAVAQFATGAALMQRALQKAAPDPAAADGEGAGAVLGGEETPLADRGRQNAGPAKALAKSPRSKRGTGAAGGGKSPSAKQDPKKMWHSGPVTSKAALAASGAPAQGQEPLYVRRKRAPGRAEGSPGAQAHPEPAARGLGAVLFRHKSLTGTTPEDEDSSEPSHSHSHSHNHAHVRAPRSPFRAAEGGGGGARGMVERLGQSLRRAGSLGKDGAAERRKGRGHAGQGAKSPRRGGVPGPEGGAGEDIAAEGATEEEGEEFEQMISDSLTRPPAPASMGMGLQDFSPPSRARAWLEDSGAPQVVLGKFTSKVVAANGAALAALGFAAEAQAQERNILDLCEGVSGAEWSRAVSSLLAEECKEFPIRMRLLKSERPSPLNGRWVQLELRLVGSGSASELAGTLREAQTSPQGLVGAEQPLVRRRNADGSPPGGRPSQEEEEEEGEEVLEGELVNDEGEGGEGGEEWADQQGQHYHQQQQLQQQYQEQQQQQQQQHYLQEQQQQQYHPQGALQPGLEQTGGGDSEAWEGGGRNDGEGQNGGGPEGMPPRSHTFDDPNMGAHMGAMRAPGGGFMQGTGAMHMPQQHQMLAPGPHRQVPMQMAPQHQMHVAPLVDPRHALGDPGAFLQGQARPARPGQPGQPGQPQPQPLYPGHHGHADQGSSGPSEGAEFEVPLKGSEGIQMPKRSLTIAIPQASGPPGGQSSSSPEEPQAGAGTGAVAGALAAPGPATARSASRGTRAAVAVASEPEDERARGPLSAPAGAQSRRARSAQEGGGGPERQRLKGKGGDNDAARARSSSRTPTRGASGVPLGSTTRTLSQKEGPSAGPGPARRTLSHKSTGPAAERTLSHQRGAGAERMAERTLSTKGDLKGPPSRRVEAPAPVSKPFWGRQATAAPAKPGYREWDPPEVKEAREREGKERPASWLALKAPTLRREPQGQSEPRTPRGAPGAQSALRRDSSVKRVEVGGPGAPAASVGRSKTPGPGVRVAGEGAQNFRRRSESGAPQGGQGEGPGRGGVMRVETSAGRGGAVLARTETAREGGAGGSRGDAARGNAAGRVDVSKEGGIVRTDTVRETGISRTETMRGVAPLVRAETAKRGIIGAALQRSKTGEEGAPSRSRSVGKTRRSASKAGRGEAEGAPREAPGNARQDQDEPSMMRMLTWSTATGNGGGGPARQGSTGRGLLQRQQGRAAEPQVQFSLRALKGADDEEPAGGVSGRRQQSLGRTQSHTGDEQARQQPQAHQQHQGHQQQQGQQHQTQLSRNGTLQQPSEGETWTQQQQQQVQMQQQGYQHMASGVPAAQGHAVEGDGPRQPTPPNMGTPGEGGVPEAGVPGQGRPFISKRSANTADNISTYEHGSTLGAPPLQAQAQMQLPRAESLKARQMQQQQPQPAALADGGGGWEAVALLGTQSQVEGEEEAQAWQGTEPLTPGRRSGGEDKDGPGGGGRRVRFAEDAGERDIPRSRTWGAADEASRRKAAARGAQGPKAGRKQGAAPEGASVRGGKGRGKGGARGSLKGGAEGEEGPEMGPKGPHPAPGEAGTLMKARSVGRGEGEAARKGLKRRESARKAGGGGAGEEEGDERVQKEMVVERLMAKLHADYAPKTEEEREEEQAEREREREREKKLERTGSKRAQGGGRERGKPPQQQEEGKGEEEEDEAERQRQREQQAEKVMALLRTEGGGKGSPEGKGPPEKGPPTREPSRKGRPTRGAPSLGPADETPSVNKLASMKRRQKGGHVLDAVPVPGAGGEGPEAGAVQHQYTEAAPHGSQGAMLVAPLAQGPVNGQYPNGQYPNGQYPNGQYPNGQFPNGQYQNGQYPNGQYPPGQPASGQYQGWGPHPGAPQVDAYASAMLNLSPRKTPPLTPQEGPGGAPRGFQEGQGMGGPDQMPPRTNTLPAGGLQNGRNGRPALWAPQQGQPVHPHQQQQQQQASGPYGQPIAGGNWEYANGVPGPMRVGPGEGGQGAQGRYAQGTPGGVPASQAWFPQPGGQPVYSAQFSMGKHSHSAQFPQGKPSMAPMQARHSAQFPGPVKYQVMPLAPANSAGPDPRGAPVFLGVPGAYPTDVAPLERSYTDHR